MAQSDKILLVDDNPVNIDLLEMLLGDDYVLETASSGEQALQVTQKFHPDLILLDIMMPGIDGYETCRQLRAMPPSRHIKIIMVSAKAMVPDRLQGYEAGADDYISKPFNNGELLAKVRVYLQLKSLQEIDHLKTDVLTLLSHETNTPLNGILGPLQLLREAPEMEASERNELIEMAYSSATCLHTLYSKVCTLSAMRAGRGFFTYASADIRKVVQTAITITTPAAAARGVHIALTCPEAAMAELDSERIQEVVTALLENAIEVSSLDSQVDVCVVEEDAHICISVTDHGPGIAEDFVAHVFQPFARDDMRHHTGGHGLSLAIAKQIVEAHKGTIAVESAPDKGSTFTVRVPIGLGPA
ncbi:MAG: hybrid sensor histidine kinase/response regulator [Candidatus Tectomicrobia bacterium]|nr:hybrid sensor histidine kinase/response regulator [Candidatus Tectomicrobia bacterium]